MNNVKMKMSQDQLYKYLMDHDVKLSRLAEQMGLSLTAVSAYFRHLPNMHGNPRTFSVDNIKKLNDAIRSFSQELRACLLHFGTDKMYTNKHGRTYDPGMIDAINRLGKYINTTALIYRLLGWNKSKKANVFGASTNKNYGNISKDDVDVLNVEILSVAGFLNNVEVVPDDNAFGDGSK
ncbi:MAG: hypothetical protein ACOCNX_00615 [Prevotella sp.]